MVIKMFIQFKYLCFNPELEQFRVSNTNVVRSDPKDVLYWISYHTKEVIYQKLVRNRMKKWEEK